MSDAAAHDGAEPTGRARWENVDKKPMITRGQGKVWRVRDTLSGGRDLFALKEMKFHKGPGSTAYRRFEREVTTMTRLSESHSGIVPVVDHGIPKEEDAWGPYYVMPLASSSLDRAKDLESHLEAVLKIGLNVTDALLAAHRAGVIHRDVKPGNVLLFGDERTPKLCDFGICYLIDEEERLTGLDAQTVGSKDFTAPEVLGGGTIEEVDVRVDVYSLGKTLYAVVAGGRVFPREEHQSAKWNLVERFDDPRFEHLHGLLQRMATSDPEERLPDMAACKQVLERALANIRRGIPYSAGMYGGRAAAAERYLRLDRDLKATAGARRNDLIFEATEEGFRSARERIARTAQPNRYERDLLEGDSDVAIACAEDIVAAGAPLIVEEDRDGFEEWLHRLRKLLKYGEAGSLTREQLILSDAAVLAVYLAAAYAWRKRRWSALAALVEPYAREPWQFIYLPLQAGTSSRSAGWIEKAIEESQLASRLDPWLAGNAADAVNLVSGLALLRRLSLLPEDRLAQLRGGRDLHLDDFPALFHDRMKWIPFLASELLQSPSVLRGLSTEVFKSDPDTFRTFLRELMPILNSLLSYRARNFHRAIEWRWDVDPEGTWNKLVQPK